MARITDVRPVFLALMLAAGLLGACGGGDEAPAPTPGETGTPTATATAGATPRATAPTPAPVQPEWSISLDPGDRQTAVVLRDGTSETTVALMSPEQAQFEPWDVAFDVDLDGDGIDEAVVSHYTGGAHCCLDYAVFASGPGGIEQVDAFGLGNSGIEDVSDLDGNRIPEIKTYDDRLAYFVDIPYAVSPSLPLVLCRSADGTYSDCTPEFPALLKGAAQEFKDRLADAVQQGAGREETHGIALGLAASYMRIGMAEEGRNQVADLCEECRTWLLDNYAELEARLGFPMPYRN